MKDIKKFAPTQRFSSTVEYYVKYRPHYPTAVVTLLEQHGELNSKSVIADIGSGTGIFSKLLLENGCSVIGVEPNAEMRTAAENYLADYKHFTSVDGSAENTTLEDSSVDIIAAAQAFHWFDLVPVKKEFERILKPNGWVVLLWNLRDSSQPGFMAAYEELLQELGTDYRSVCAEGVDENSIRDFFAPNAVKIVIFPNEQTVDWDGLKGRLQSTSYVPKEGDPNFDVMIAKAKEIFDTHQNQGKVKFIYQTKVYVGHLNS